MESPAFQELSHRCSEQWPNVRAAAAATAEVRTKLQALEKYESPDCAIVVMGSIGRGEYAAGGDVDWTLLIDGPADPAHLNIARTIADELDGLGLRGPGRTETFGAMASSHELVHHIAGVRDTNQNLTRRILLLIESLAITEPLVRQRVIKNILHRYIVHDETFPQIKPADYLIPHFLLNDTVRYWRTMASDYAAKVWERGASEWALKNVKLRFSRKMILIAGMLAAFAYELDSPADRAELAKDKEQRDERLVAAVTRALDRTPIEAVSETLLRSGDLDLSRRLIGAYDGFLGIMGDEHCREELKGLSLESAQDSTLWREARQLSHGFREAVQALFFETDPVLSALTKRYGVF